MIYRSQSCFPILFHVPLNFSIRKLELQTWFLQLTSYVTRDKSYTFLDLPFFLPEWVKQMISKVSSSSRNKKFLPGATFKPLEVWRTYLLFVFLVQCPAQSQDLLSEESRKSLRLLSGGIFNLELQKTKSLGTIPQSSFVLLSISLLTTSIHLF